MWCNLYQPLWQLPTPSLLGQWLDNISKEFSDVWNFLDAIGSIDGKHVVNSGTLFYSYKSFYSIVLLAMFDAKYNFILFDIGQYGTNNDCGVLSKSTMGKLIESKSLNIPEQATLEGC